MQLARVRAFAKVARGDVHPPVLEAMLDGRKVPDGLAVDTDLRWALIAALAALGRVGDAAVDAELARDDTARGRQHALQTRAAMPDAARKEWAWLAAMHDPALSNHETSFLAAGFRQPGQDELLRPYVDRYIAELPDTWAARTPQVAASLASSLFPAVLVEQEVLDATAVLLDAQHPDGLRRLVAEQRDDLGRALRARAAV